MSPARRAERRDTMLHAALRQPLIMGILNVTPDSFSDGGLHAARHDALSRAGEMEEEGADMIDIGGESTRPGATPVEADDESQRVLSIIKELSERSSKPLSIDTYKAIIAQQAAQAGAVLINDVSGLSRDPEMADTVAKTACAVVITYNRGETSSEINLVDDARAFFDQAFAQARRAGIPKAHIWLDPGVGFAKTQLQNLEILRRLDVLQDYQCPVLVGLSRKSFIGHVLDRPVEARLTGSIAANLFALERGAQILRVHDVQEHHDAIRLHTALLMDQNAR